MEAKYKIAIIGGKLQGTEAAYLAKKAGFYSILFDKNLHAPASVLCDEFHCIDICSEEPKTLEILLSADLILPAMENNDTLSYLKRLSEKHPVKIAFDFHAYSISSSKLKSDSLFKEHDIPSPSYYPNCKPPYIAKPSSESGSTGVRILSSRCEAERFLSEIKPSKEWIIQEQLGGPSYSLEIIGKPGAYRTYQITQIHMDDIYDCNRVTCPCDVSDAQKKSFEDMAFKIANIVKLNGIMDLEVIDDNGTFKILEIDARIPSQTPTAVYFSTGVNLLAELVDLYEGRWDVKETGLKRLDTEEKFASYEHFFISDNQLQFPGEHIMGGAKPLTLYRNHLGSDEVITDYKEGDEEFKGTFINSGETLLELEEKRRQIKSRLSETMIEHGKSLIK